VLPWFWSGLLSACVGPDDNDVRDPDPPTGDTGSRDPSEPSEGPRVVAQTPLPGATDVAPRQVVRVQFARPLDTRASPGPTIGITANGAPLPVDVTIEEAEIVVTPAVRWPVLADVAVTLPAGLTDVDGKVRGSDRTFTFRVREGAWSKAEDLVEQVRDVRTHPVSNRLGAVHWSLVHDGPRGDMRTELRYLPDEQVFTVGNESWIPAGNVTRHGIPRSGINDDGQIFLGSHSQTGAGDDASYVAVGRWFDVASGWNVHAVGFRFYSPLTSHQAGITGDGRLGLSSFGVGSDRVLLAFPRESPDTVELVEDALLEVDPHPTALGFTTIGDDVLGVFYGLSGGELFAARFRSAAPSEPDVTTLATAADINFGYWSVRPAADGSVLVAWGEDRETHHYAVLAPDGRVETGPLGDGLLGPAFCANAAGQRLAAYPGTDLWVRTAEPGGSFTPPRSLATIEALEYEYADCVIDESGNGFVIFTGFSPERPVMGARYADGNWSAAPLPVRHAHYRGISIDRYGTINLMSVDEAGTASVMRFE